ncbi:MAG: hypothetical protein J6Q67_02960 [Clostridia bacterium]|nr:hypothetical protein [Clostridia bacterium]
MKNKSIRILVMVVICIINVIVLLLINDNNGQIESSDESDYFVTQYYIDKSRTEEAYLVPDFSYEVTDVRITVKKRDVNYAKMYEGIVDEVEAANTTVYQIYYGYFSNGEWHDIPVENYELKGLSSPNIDGWQTAQNNHVVKIGSKLLLAFPVGRGKVSTYSPYAIIKDSLGSEVQSITEYYSTSSKIDAFSGSLLLLENALALNTAEYGWFILDFDKWYYIILDYSDFTSEYSITVNQFWDSSEKPTYKNTYTYNDIMEALNRK